MTERLAEWLRDRQTDRRLRGTRPHTPSPQGGRRRASLTDRHGAWLAGRQAPLRGALPPAPSNRPALRPAGTPPPPPLPAACVSSLSATVPPTHMHARILSHSPPSFPPLSLSLSLSLSRQHILPPGWPYPSALTQASEPEPTHASAPPPTQLFWRVDLISDRPPSHPLLPPMSHRKSHPPVGPPAPAARPSPMPTRISCRGTRPGTSSGSLADPGTPTGVWHSRMAGLRRQIGPGAATSAPAIPTGVLWQESLSATRLSRDGGSGTAGSGPAAPARCGQRSLEPPARAPKPSFSSARKSFPSARFPGCGEPPVRRLSPARHPGRVRSSDGRGCGAAPAPPRPARKSREPPLPRVTAAPGGLRRRRRRTAGVGAPLAERAGRHEPGRPGGPVPRPRGRAAPRPVAAPPRRGARRRPARGGGPGGPCLPAGLVT